MKTDWRALCVELMQELESALDDIGLVNEPCISLIDRARAALARWGHPAPVPVSEPVAWLWEYIGSNPYTHNFSPVARSLREMDPTNPPLPDNWRPVAPLYLARWGHQPAQPAEGEQRHPAPVPVASDTYFEFVISDADYCTQAGGIVPTYAQALSEGQHYLAQYQQDGPHTLELRRVEVLNPDALPEQRQAAPVPVAVSERLPGPEDCDAGGRCWAWDWLAEKWCLCDRTSACHGFDHWLPATALPLPAGELELNAE